MPESMRTRLLNFANILKQQGVDIEDSEPQLMTGNSLAIERKITGRIYLALWLDYILGEESLFCGFSAYSEEPIKNIIATAPESLQPVLNIRGDMKSITRGGKKWLTYTMPDPATVFDRVVLERPKASSEAYYGIYFRPQRFDAHRAAHFIQEVRKASIEPITGAIDLILYDEGRAMRVDRTIRSRSGSVRTACLEHYKKICSGCDLDCNQFGDQSDIIEVHHLNPISLGETETDPIKDCRPLCPTCHRLAHYGQPINKPLSIFDIRQRRGMQRRQP